MQDRHFAITWTDGKDDVRPVVRVTLSYPDSDPREVVDQEATGMADAVVKHLKATSTFGNYKLWHDGWLTDSEFGTSIDPKQVDPEWVNVMVYDNSRDAMFAATRFGGVEVRSIDSLGFVASVSPARLADFRSHLREAGLRHEVQSPVQPKPYLGRHWLMDRGLPVVNGDPFNDQVLPASMRAYHGGQNPRDMLDLLATNLRDLQSVICETGGQNPRDRQHGIREIDVAESARSTHPVDVHREAATAALFRTWAEVQYLLVATRRTLYGASASEVTIRMTMGQTMVELCKLVGRIGRSQDVTAPQS